MRTSLVKALFPEVKPEHKKPLTQKSGALCREKPFRPSQHTWPRAKVYLSTDAHLFSQVTMKAAQRAFY